MDTWRLLERVFGWGGVLAYHGVAESVHSPVMHVTPERLRAQLTRLRDRYHVVTLDELLSRWRHGRSTRGCVAITFDDAYAGIGRWVVPVIRDLDVPVTIFVAAEHARMGARYWWDTAERARLTRSGGEWDRCVAAVSMPPLPAREIGSMARLREHVIARHGGRWPGTLQPAPQESPWRSHTFEELRAIAREARIDFGVHTLTHPALPMIPAEEQRREIREAHRVLCDELPSVLPVIAYPYGLYDRATIAAARGVGMQAAVTMEGRAPGARPDPFTIPRVGAGNLHAPESLTLRLHRVLRPALIVRNRGMHPRVPRPTSAQASRRTMSRADGMVVE